jgi:hypothetical protein
MGVDRNIHIGPYIKAKKKLEEVVKEKIKTCSNIECKIHKKKTGIHDGSKFCSVCGSKIEIHTFETKKNLTIDDVFSENENFEDSMYSPGSNYGETDTLISNQHSPWDRHRIVDVDNHFDLSIELMNIQQEIDWFKETFASQILYLENRMGKENISVHWGVINYFS